MPPGPMCRNETAPVAACLPFPIASVAPETGPVNGVTVLYLGSWVQNSGRELGILKWCRNLVLKRRIRGTQKTALPESQGIKGIRQSEAGAKQGKCKVSGLGTSCDCQQQCVVFTDPIAT